MQIANRLITSLKIAVVATTLSLALLPAFAAALPSAPTLLVHDNVPMQLTASVCKAHDFFGLTPWYGYLSEYKDSQGECAVCFNVTNTANFDTTDCPKAKTSSVPLIGLAVVDDLLRIAGIIAVAYIIYGAIQYITSQGNPDATSKAQGTIVNALIGVAIASVAVVFVAFVGSKLGG
jgi:hypothetical protein